MLTVGGWSYLYIYVFLITMGHKGKNFGASFQTSGLFKHSIYMYYIKCILTNSVNILLLKQRNIILNMQVRKCLSVLIIAAFRYWNIIKIIYSAKTILRFIVNDEILCNYCTKMIKAFVWKQMWSLWKLHQTYWNYQYFCQNFCTI